jgi:hypothetical protein
MVKDTDVLTDIDMMIMLHEMHRKNCTHDAHWRQMAAERERWDGSDGLLRRAVRAVRALFTAPDASPAEEPRTEPVRLALVPRTTPPSGRLRIVTDGREQSAT